MLLLFLRKAFSTFPVNSTIPSLSENWRGKIQRRVDVAARRGCRGYMGFVKRPSLLRRRSFSNSTADVYAGIPEVLENMVGIKTLIIGYTKDIELAESRLSDWRAPAFHLDLSGRLFAELE